MSGAESEAIVVAGSEGEEEVEQQADLIMEGGKEKQCSGCRSIQAIDQFQGTDKYAGKTMRTCNTCRGKSGKEKVLEKICSDCRTIQPIDQFRGVKRYEGKEMRTCSNCRSRKGDASFMSTRASDGSKKGTLMPDIGNLRDSRRNRIAIGETRKKMLNSVGKQWVDDGKTLTDKNMKDIAERQKLEPWEIPQVKKYLESAIDNEKARKKEQVAVVPPGRKTANSVSASTSVSTAEHTPKSSPQPTMSKEAANTRSKPVTRGQTEQATAAPHRRRLTNNSNQATTAAELGDSSDSPVSVTKSTRRVTGGSSDQMPIKIDDTASEAEESDVDIRELRSKPKSPPQTRAQSKRTVPASTGRSTAAGAKKRSTPPPSSSSIDPEDAFQAKRPRTQQEDKEKQSEKEEDEEEEESNPRADLEAFATSLERLSKLLFAARDNLTRKQVGVLENDIHHDWKVDEMSTFVEGFLRGADALNNRLKD